MLARRAVAAATTQSVRLTGHAFAVVVAGAQASGPGGEFGRGPLDPRSRMLKQRGVGVHGFGVC
jgi:hypothetical protein